MEQTQETRVQSLGQQGPLEKRKATHPSILAQEITQTKEPGRLWSIGAAESDTTAEHTHTSKPSPSLEGPSAVLLPSLFLSDGWMQ